jgi:hypothetical protein
MQHLSGNILTPTGFVQGNITLDAQGRIGAISGTPVAIEFEETTRLRESITSNIPCLTRLKPCPSQSPTTASGRW